MGGGQWAVGNGQSVMGNGQWEEEEGVAAGRAALRRDRDCGKGGRGREREGRLGREEGSYRQTTCAFRRGSRGQ